MSCELLAFLFERDRGCAGSRGGLHGECPYTADIRSRLGPHDGAHQENGSGSSRQKQKSFSRHSAPFELVPNNIHLRSGCAESSFAAPAKQAVNELTHPQPVGGNSSYSQ